MLRGADLLASIPREAETKPTSENLAASERPYDPALPLNAVVSCRGCDEAVECLIPHQWLAWGGQT